MIALSHAFQNELYERVRLARAYMDTYYYLPLDLNQTSREAGFSRYHFIRLFRQTYHKTPHQYLIQKRIEKAKKLLVDSELSITEICFAVGFQSLGSFSTLFDKYIGCSPTAYRANFLEHRQTSPNFVPTCYLTFFRIDSSASC